LVNIGITLSRLERLDEAANTYQQYLDAPDAEERTRAEVSDALVALDRKLGVLALAVEPRDAEVQVNGGVWVGVAQAKLIRVAPGAYSVRARAPNHESGQRNGDMAAGQRSDVVLTLSAVAVPEPPMIRPPPMPLERPSRRLGVVALANFDIEGRGAAARVGATFELTTRVELHGAAILGPSLGGYFGGTVAITRGRVRPVVALGVPIFVSNGARLAGRGAAGVHVLLGRHLSLIAEFGAEYQFNPEADIEELAIVPSLGAAGRL
jgi:hypothetical protein